MKGISMRTAPKMIDAMTPFPHTVEASQLVKEAKTIMYGKSIRHLPVVEHGKAVGILSDRDVKLAYAVLGDDIDEDSLRVGEACIYDVFTVDVDEPLDKVLKHMVEHHIGSAVVTKATKVVGIFTSTDACKKLAELLKLHFPDA
jgi:acetoin utilization protein AcuB